MSDYNRRAGSAQFLASKLAAACSAKPATAKVLSWQVNRLDSATSLAAPMPEFPHMTEKDPMKIAIASDHAGYELKEKLKKAFEDVEWLDLGTHSEASVDYPDFGFAMGRAITDGTVETGLVVCGSGIGISIAVNRFAAVRAALCTDATMARLSRQHNDANVLALGSRIIGIEVARECVSAFLNTPFEGARHQRRVDMLSEVGQG